MTETSVDLADKVALITGAARRIGKAIAQTLHGAGMNIALHCNGSMAEAERLIATLNQVRSGSASAFQADFMQVSEIKTLAKRVVEQWGRLDVLVNNASVFYPVSIEEADEARWDETIGVNLKSPLFLTKYLSAELKRRRGCIVNIGDIHANRPLKGHMLYSVAKAGVHMLTKSLARELAPEVRCNAIAPGALLWPEVEGRQGQREEIVTRTALKRGGSAQDAAAAVLFLVRDAGYITGQIIAVDGGRSLSN